MDRLTELLGERLELVGALSVLLRCAERGLLPRASTIRRARAILERACTRPESPAPDDFEGWSVSGETMVRLAEEADRDPVSGDEYGTIGERSA